MSEPPRLYRGHRANSFRAADVNELVEIRARERTFDGAYRRTATGCLGFAVTILRLFDRRLYKVGILYVILAVMLYTFAYFRQRHSRHDFADQYPEKPPIVTIVTPANTPNSHTSSTDDASNDTSPSTPNDHNSDAFTPNAATMTMATNVASEARKNQGGESNKRIFGRPFVTAGWIVLGVFLGVVAIEVALLFLILTLKLPHH